MNKNVNSEMIILARESRGLTQSNLARALNLSQGQMSKIENGSLKVSEEILKTLCKVLDYPADFFTLDEQFYGAGMTFIFHRSRKSLSQKITSKIEAQIEIYRIAISKLLRSIEYDIKFPVFSIDEYSGSIEDIARSVRSIWLLPRGPVINLSQAIEKAGGIIIRCDFGTPKIDALSKCWSGMPPLFFINKNIPSDRVRFSLAHELGHVIMHNMPRPDMEDEADIFAAEFLMPAQEIGSSLNNITLPKLAALKPHWKVSMAALLKRAVDLKKITDRKARFMWMQLGKAGYKMREPIELDIPMEKPTSLKHIIDIYTSQLNYSLAELSGVVALHPDEFKANYLGEENHLKLVRFNN